MYTVTNKQRNIFEMLDKLQIRNFRKNEKLDVDLEPITVFRGPSGSGKSSLVGAIKWLAFNTPAGKDFIHWDHSSSVVRVTEGKTQITRKRSSSDNYYRIDKQKPLKAFGASVPDGVVNLLNINPLNFHRQSAGPFWFCETAGEVSRQLNTIVNLDLIDTTLSNLSEQQRKSNSEKKVIEQRIKDAKIQKKKLRYILGIDKRLKTLELLEKQHEEGATQIITLIDLLNDAAQYQAEAKQPIPKIKPLMKLCKEHKQLEKQQYQLTELYSEATNLIGMISCSDSKIKQDEKELKKLVGNTCPWCGKKV